jgi:hypothetical protein
MENIFLASTNLYGLRAAGAVGWGTIQSNAIIFAVIASFLMHWTETKKHYMPGIKGKWGMKQMEVLFYRADIAAVVMVPCMVIASFPKNDICGVCTMHYLWVCCALVSHAISGALGRIIPDSKHMYVVSHTVWHTSVFHCLFLLGVSVH